MGKRTDWLKKNVLGADDTNDTNVNEPEDRMRRRIAGELAASQRKKNERDNEFLKSEQERAIKEHASNSEVPVTPKSLVWPQRRHRKHRRERQQIEVERPETSSTEQGQPAASELEATPSAPPHVHVPDQRSVSRAPRSNRASPDKHDGRKGGSPDKPDRRKGASPDKPDGRKGASPSKKSGAGGRSPSQDQSGGGRRTIPDDKNHGHGLRHQTELSLPPLPDDKIVDRGRPLPPGTRRGSVGIRETFPSIRHVGGLESQFTTLPMDLASPSFDFNGLVPNTDLTNLTGSQPETETDLDHRSRLKNGPRSHPDPPSCGASLPPTPSYPVVAEPGENKNQSRESHRSHVMRDNLNSVHDESPLNDPRETNAPESDGNASNNEGERLSDPVLAMGRGLLKVMFEYEELFPEEIRKFQSRKHIIMGLDCLIKAHNDLSMKTSSLEKKLKMQESAYDSLKGTDTTLAQELDERRSEIAQLKKESATKDGQILMLNELIDKRETKMEELRTKHQTERDTSEKEATALKSEHNQRIIELEKEYQEKIIDAGAKARQDVEEAMQALQDAFDKVEKDHQLTKDSHKEQLEIIGREHDEKILKLEKWYEDQNKVLTQDLLNQSEKAKKDLDEAKRAFEAEKDKAVQDYLRKLNNAQIQIEQERIRYEAAIKKLKEEHTNEMAHNREWYATRAAQSKEKHDSDRELLENELERVKTEIVEVKNTAQKELENHLREMEVKVTKAISSKETEIETMKEEYEAKIADLRANQEAKLLALTKDLREKVEALNAALVKRDHFKIMSDYDVARGFDAIEIDIEDLASKPWDLSRELLTWPFKSRAFEPKKDRRPKKNIIKSKLWFILYEMVFCTPFQALGPEGKILERQWMQEFGQNQRQTGGPLPSKESEEWRYRNITKCVKAVSQPLKDWEPNSWDFKIRQGYETTLEKAKDNILQELEKVAPREEADRQKLTELVKKAVNLWLEVGQQRCRMFLLMSASAEDIMTSRPGALGPNRPLELVIRPTIYRMGTAEGERLDKEELVKDCEGSFSTFQSAL